MSITIANLTYAQLEGMTDEELVAIHQSQKDSVTMSILVGRYYLYLKKKAIKQAAISGIDQQEYESEYNIRFLQAVDKYLPGNTKFGIWLNEQVLKFANRQVTTNSIYCKTTVTNEDGSKEIKRVKKLESDGTSIDSFDTDGEDSEYDDQKPVIRDEHQNVEGLAGMNEGLFMDYLDTIDATLYAVASLVADGYGYEDVSDEVRGLVNSHGKMFSEVAKRTWTHRKVDEIRDVYLTFIHENKITSILK